MAPSFYAPRFGHSADQGGRRTPWILGGVALLALGAICAALSVGVMAQNATYGILAAIPAFLLIGLGIGAAGTNLLALLAARVAQDRQAAAGSLVWIMMIFGLAATGITAGQLLDPYTHTRLVQVACGVGMIAMLLSIAGVWGQERGPCTASETQKRGPFCRCRAHPLVGHPRAFVHHFRFCVDVGVQLAGSDP